MKTIIGTISIIILFLCSGCDYYCDYFTGIDNQTADTVICVFSGTTAYVQTVDTVVALPHQETIYFEAISATRVFPKNWECDPKIASDEVVVTTSSGRTLMKDISDKNNWYCETYEGASYWRMIFLIEEENLE